MLFKPLNFLAASIFLSTGLTGPTRPSLNKRDCDYSVDCYCVGATTDLYCGYCVEVLGPIVYGTDVYQCNIDGSCCDFGPRDSCAAGELTGDLSQCGFENS